MKHKQILSLVLAFLMIISSFPIPAYAASDGVEVEDVFADAFPAEEEVPMQQEQMREDSEEALDELLEESALDEQMVSEAPSDESLHEQETDEVDQEEFPEESEWGTEEPIESAYENDNPQEDSTEDDPDSPSFPDEEYDDADMAELFEEMLNELYNGSYIQFAIDNNSYVYVITRQPCTIYREEYLQEPLCELAGSGATLLATDFGGTTGNSSIQVWFLTSDMEPIQGFVREDNLEKKTLSADEVDQLMAEQDYLLIQHGEFFLPAFIALWEAEKPEYFEPEDQESEYLEQDQESDTGTDTETLENAIIESDDLAEEVPLEAEDTEKAFSVKSIPLLGASPEMYATTTPIVPIDTRPTAYMTADRYGYTYIDSGMDSGDLRSSIGGLYQIMGTTLTVLGFTRYHHALVKAEWENPQGETILILAEAAYMMPVSQTITCEVVDKQGYPLPNHPVTVYNGKGQYVTTIESDDNGIARYTGLHMDVNAAIAFASVYYTGSCLIDNNDCASFVSECLTYAGFPVYGAYASKSAGGPNSYGYGLYDRLASLGVPGKTNPSIEDLSPGDVAFLHPTGDPSAPYGHAMIIAEVNQSSGKVLVYGHSTSAKDPTESDKMWIEVSKIGFASFTSIYDYRFDYDLPTSPGKIVVLKEDAATGAALAGAVIELIKDGKVVATKTTDKTGKATFADLEPGEYTVQEKTAPSGYITTASTYPATVKEGCTTEVVVRNEKEILKGSFTVKKRDKDEQNTFLPGAVFALYDSTGKLISEKTTGIDGTATWTDLPIGKYELREITAPAGYEILAESCSVEVTQTPATYVVDNAKEQPKTATIQVLKVSENGSLPLKNVIFELVVKRESKYQRAIGIDGKELPTITTDENGMGAWKDVVPYGDYYIHEVTPPDGYTADSDYHAATVSEQTKLVKVTVSDQVIRSKIKIIKTDSETGNALAGAVFTVTRLSIPASQSSGEIGQVVATLTTDAQGFAESDWLEYGLYEIKEIKAPDGYLDAGFVKKITAAEDQKTYTIEVENSPEKEKIKITKTDLVDGSPIEGVIFDIYQGNAQVGTMTTNASGVAISEDLPTGHYTVKERNLPDGYTGELAVLECDVTAGKTVSLSANNQPIQFRIKVLKTDSETQMPLSGAEFTITRKDTGKTVATLTTDKKGEAVSDLLRFGEYEVKETKAPENYIDKGYTAVVNGTEHGKTYELKVENDQFKGAIRLTKTDRVDGSPIEDVVFDIYQGSTLVGTMTTDSAGVAVSETLPAGHYTVKERSLPHGYTGDLASLECDVQSGAVTELKADNRPIQIRIKIVKTDAETGSPLAGAEFTVIRSHEETVATLTTDGQGEAITDWLRYGDYIVQETKAPDNYINASFVAVISGTEDGKTYELEIENEQMQGGIRITKIDMIDGSPISGVVFDIFQGSTKVDSIVTNAAGVAVSKALPAGHYTVKEQSLPTGYMGELSELECDVTGNQLTDLAVENQPIQFRVKISKLDAVTHAPLAGAEFTITRKSDGKKIAVLTTDNKGEALSDFLRFGEYEVTETRAPENYVNGGYSILINGEENGEILDLTVENEPMRGGIRIVKTDRVDGSPIAGVTFDIYQGESLIGSMITNASGIAVSDDLPEGNYTVKEHTLPDGYTGDLVSLDCTVKSNEITDLQVENTPIQFRVKIIKTDASTKGPVAGAEFSIVRMADGERVATLITDTNGEAISDLLRYGKYEVTETKVPVNYMDKGYSTSISGTENGKTYELHVENEPMQGGIWLTKTDKLDGSPIAGVAFDIFQGDKLVASMTTNESGLAVSGNLPKGNYTVKERALPTGYTGNLVSLNCDVAAGKSTELTATNEPIQFKVKIVKTDSLTKEPLAGAVFTITHKGSATAVATLTTDSKGEATSGLMRYGEYEIKETQVPANYVDSKFSTTVTGTEHNKIYVVEAENQPMQGGIRITKTDKLDGSPIGGVVFDIYQGETLVGSMTTNASGVAVSGELPKGNYTVKEHALPEGYTGELVSLDCTVKTSEITELKVENKPIQFQVKILKTDSITKEPLAGVEFTITSKASGKAVATLTTDSRGEAVSGMLRYGEYIVTETKTPAHYAESTFSTTVKGTKNEKVYEIEVENTPTMGQIRLTKTDALGGTPISGVTFDIYDDDKLVGSMKTGENGIALSDPLPKGIYTVKEHAAPEGYVATLFTQDCAVKSDEVTELKVENMPIQFKIRILKTDALTQESLPGAEFTVRRISGLPSQGGAGDGEIIATLVTDANGETVTDWLTWGKYEVTETKVPVNFIDSHYSETVTGTENEKIYTLNVSNEPMKGWIRLTKTDKLDGTPIAGVVFDIYQGETKVSSMTTGVDGVAKTEALLKGKYTVKEHALPEGYTGDLVSLDCEVKSQETTELMADNMPIQFKVKIIKTDKLTQEPLSGAVFTITRKTGLSSHNGVDKGAVVATLTTDANGEAMTDLLTWGVYEVKETTVPEHYVDNHYSATVTGSENEKVYEIRVENEPAKGWIRLTKADRLDGHTIAGVVFDILQNGKIVTSMTTGADGVAVSEPIAKGKYTVKEHANPTGYTNELFSADCEVYSDVTTRLTADNKPIQGRIKVIKKDELTKALLSGAEFTITRVSGLPSHNGDDNGEKVAVLATDNSGTAVSPLLTWGTYKIEETKVPEHFVDNHFSAIVVIKENDKTYEITAENEPTKGWIELIKTDALDRTPIAGVQFDIYENDEYGSGLAGTMTTDENGVAKSPALRKGKYMVKEHENPTGYVSDLATVECAVKSDETTHISATNQPIQGKIRIVKTDELTKEALAGAEFTVTRISGLPSHNGSNDGEVVAVITTDADGIAVTPLLTWGTYKVEETGIPVHYVDNAYSTEVTIQEENLMTIDVPVENEPTKGWIRLTKTDRKNGNPISGVQFDIYYNDQYGEGQAAAMITGEDGVALSEPLRKGKYIVKEHGHTPGYLSEEVTLECTVKSDETTLLTASNQPVMTRLKLYKRDIEEWEPEVQMKKKSLSKNVATIPDPSTRGDAILTGAVFSVLAGEDILDRQGNIIFEKGAIVLDNLKTSGEDASVLTNELWPGVYEIVEVAPPTGYLLDETSVWVDTTDAALQSTEAVITYAGVKANEVLYGRYTFVKFYGDNQVHDDAGLIEKPEPDAVFHVYLKSAGSYDAARKFERDTFTTDRNGKAQTRLLPYGIYTVEQVKGKKGYAIKAPFDIFIRGTEDPNDPPTMIINNEAIHYRLKFIKIDAETGNTITAAHTSFKLKDSEGNLVKQKLYYSTEKEIDTFVTDENGEVTLPETLIYGLYFAQEFAAPEGYLIAGDEIPVFVGDDHLDQPGEAYLLEYKVENEPVKGRILLDKKGLQLTGFEEKQDSFGNTYHQPVYEEKYLAGAVFEIHAAEDVIGKDGTVWYHADELVDTITTTAAGSDASKVVPLGKYYLVETQAPEGFIFSDERYEVNLEYADDHTALVEITVEAHNDYLPISVSLEKEMEIMEIVQGGDNTVRQTVSITPGKGFMFGLYNDKDIHYDGGTLLADSLVATGVTDADGKLTFSSVYPHGGYYIKELSTLDSWKLNPNAYPADLTFSNKNSDNVISVTLPEPVKNDLIYTHVTLTKTDITGQRTVPGALIEVNDEEGNIIYRAYTDENGEIPDIPVTPGRYTFKEILAPEGYELNTAEMNFSVDKDGNVTGDTVIRDDYTRFYLLKLDEAGRALPGVEFGLVNTRGEILFTAVSDEKGVITYEKIPYGTYTVMETRPLPGYVPDVTTVEITVDGTFVNPSLPLATVMNRKNTVLVKKVDQDGNPLAGAEFALCNEFGDRVDTAVSDQNGIVCFSGIPYGNYTIREIIAPQGYLPNRQVISFTIDRDFRSSEEPIATVVNHLKRLKYIKVDTSGHFLPDVEFSLINAATEEVMETVTSNENGEFIFTKFDYGVWLIRETKAPEGFNRMEDIMVSVDSDWVEPEPFTCVNIPNHYEFVKTDNEGHPLSGVKFTLENSEGNILQNLVSTEDGMVFVPGLAPGTYLIRETETLEGYTVSSEPIQVVIDEHYTVPDVIPTFINYPSIQTGAGLEMTPVMWTGIGFAGISVLLGIGYAVKHGKKKRPHNKH